MAIPFYSQTDQDIYTGGEHFIPQEQYRLGYTAPPSIANAQTTSGITNTQAANPYLYPQGGGGGGGDNYFGPNATTKMFNKNVYDASTRTWNMQDIKGYWTPSGYKTDKGKNIEHAGWLTGDPKEGDIEATETPFPSITGLITSKLRNWKKNQEIKKQEKIKAAEISGGTTVSDDQKGGFTHSGDIATGSGQGDYQAPNIRSEAEEGIDTGGAGLHGGKHYAQGGRIGYRERGFVDPEEPAENIFNFMQDQNIPFSEQVEGEEGILQQLYAKYIEAGFPPDQAEEMAMQEFQQMSQGSEQGIASLV